MEAEGHREDGGVPAGHRNKDTAITSVSLSMLLKILNKNMCSAEQVCRFTFIKEAEIRLKGLAKLLCVS